MWSVGAHNFDTVPLPLAIPTAMIAEKEGMGRRFGVLKWAARAGPAARLPPGTDRVAATPKELRPGGGRTDASRSVSFQEVPPRARFLG